MWFSKRTLMNVRQNTTLRNGNMTKKLVQFLVISDCELEMTGNDTRLLVITSSVTGQLEDFSSQVLKDSSEINRCT